MPNFAISFISIQQMNHTSPTCKVQIQFKLTGPHTDIDLVQVYAIPAGQTVANGLGDVVDTVDLTITEFEYNTLVDVPAGTAFTIALCPRSKTGDTLDDQIDGAYWEAVCIFQAFTTTLTPGIGDPLVTVGAIEPLTLNHPNQLTVSWSGTEYTDGQVLWGPVATPKANVSSFQATDQGNQPSYSGHQTFVIPGPLQGKRLSFTVQVRNSFTDYQRWYPTTVGVLAPRNYRSIRQFLEASNVRLPTGVRKLVKGAHSLRALMQI
jgi:hypothetical protein